MSNRPRDVAIRAVRVETSKGGQSRVITTVVGLAEYLLYGWPPKGGGSKHLAARAACVAALSGELSAEECRAAFLDACKEAGIFIFPEPPGR